MIFFKIHKINNYGVLKMMNGQLKWGVGLCQYQAHQKHTSGFCRSTNPPISRGSIHTKSRCHLGNQKR